jgi:hypothetical protein
MASWENSASAAEAKVAAAAAASAAAAAAAPAAAAAAVAAAPANANNHEESLKRGGIAAALLSLDKHVRSLSQSKDSRERARNTLDRIQGLISQLEGTLLPLKQNKKRHKELKSLKRQLSQARKNKSAKRIEFISKKEREERALERLRRSQIAIDPTKISATLTKLISLPELQNIRNTLDTHITSEYHRADICGPKVEGAALTGWFNTHKCTAENPDVWYDRYIRSIRCLTERIFEQEDTFKSPADSGHQAAMNFAWAAAKGCYQLIRRYQGQDPVNIKRKLPKNTGKIVRKNFSNAIANRTTRRNPRVFNKEFEKPDGVVYNWKEPYRRIGEKITSELRQ